MSVFCPSLPKPSARKLLPIVTISGTMSGCKRWCASMSVCLRGHKRKILRLRVSQAKKKEYFPRRIWWHVLVSMYALTIAYSLTFLWCDSVWFQGKTFLPGRNRHSRHDRAMHKPFYRRKPPTLSEKLGRKRVTRRSLRLRPPK